MNHDNDLSVRLQKIVSQLDTVIGMLIPASMQDPLVKEAKGIVIECSFALGDLAYELDGAE